MRAQHESLSKAREMLGVRSEHTIQREVQRTEAAYHRLVKSGTLSWREQTRAAAAMHKQVVELNNEMGKLTKLQKAASTGRGVVGTVAGITTGGYVLKSAADNAMSYDLRLAQMANTAYADRDVSGRKAGVRSLDKAIIEAIRKGGGTRDQAADTLDSLIASGAMSIGDATGLLPNLMKSAIASGADSTQLGQIAIRGMQTFKIKPQELPSIIDMAIAAGQAGGFDLKDMAKWLPQQMAAASMAGMTGPHGFAKLAALNQASVITAGSKDEAGNNLVNLLAKINSADTANDAKKLGINLPKYLTEQRAKGVDSIDAFVGLADSSVSNNTEWKELQAKLKATKDDSEKRQTLESMATIVQGSGIGQLVQDRQALMALVAIMNNRTYLADVQAKTLNSAGATDTNFGVISDTASFKSGQKDNEIAIAQQEAMNKLLPFMSALSEKTVELAREYPNLTTATVTAAGALTVLAAAAGTAGLANVLTGGNLSGISGGLSGGLSKAKMIGGFALKRLLPLWGAWEGGQAIGEHVINPMINGGVSWATGGKNSSLGDLIYELTHREPRNESGLKGEIRVRIDQDGRLSSVSTNSDNPFWSMPLDAGYSMIGP